MNAPINDCAKQNLEASFIALSGPSLNGQIDSKSYFYFETVLHENFIVLICNYI